MTPLACLVDRHLQAQDRHLIAVRGQAGVKFDYVLTRAKLQSRWRGVPLPPGLMSPSLESLERQDRKALLALFRQHGPIIKGRAWGESWIYVLGLPLIRDILRTHEADLRSVTIDASSLFPKGLLRQMEGEDHRIIRGAVVRGLRDAGAGEDFTSFRNEVAAGLSGLATSGRKDTGDDPDPLRPALANLAFGELSRSVLGSIPGTTAHARLKAAFDELGGNGLVWNLGERQKRAYGSIRAILAGTPPEGGIRAHVPAAMRDDPDLIGNLIYMVEMGRYDIAAFLRWLLWFLARHPQWAQKIRDDDTIAIAFVSEALRLEQSERLVRKVQHDFHAGGFLFPRGLKVRFCIWESHKLAEAHDDPFQFSPDRFLADKPGPERYSPFGTGHHQCPFGTYSLRLGAAFLQAVVAGFQVSDPGSGPSSRGLYHWEPAADFRPAFTRLQTPVVH